MTSLQVRPSTTIYGLVITWGQPSGSHHTTPVTYRVRYRERPSSGPPGSWSRLVVRSAREYTTPTLKPGTRYEVEVWAVASNRRGTSIGKIATTHQGMAYTTSYVAKVYSSYYVSIQKALHSLYFFIYPAPGPVTALSVTSHPTAIALIVSWQPPTGPSIPPVEGYKVQYRESPNGQWSEVVQTSAETNHYTLSGLQPGTAYDVQVWAFSSIGEDPLTKRTDSDTTGRRECLLL